MRLWLLLAIVVVSGGFDAASDKGCNLPEHTVVAPDNEAGHSACIRPHHGLCGVSTCNCGENCTCAVGSCKC
jgi:hypothetical protein